ncbi:MAG TPA: hypothetical protein VKS60_17080 [Stellaceae bacterium]|nr:hypothetical protein [Stellaceae bacterium]
MLVIHMGMPKTGTTALQKGLAAAADELLRHGIFYPDEYRNSEGIAHHALPNEIMKRCDLSGPQATKFMELVRASSAPRILISSEAFTNLLSQSSIFAFLELIRECAKQRPVRLVIACRRVDSFLESMYLHSVKVGDITAAVSDYIEARERWAKNLFAQLSVLRNINILQRLILVKYQRGPEYWPSLLRALDVRPCELVEIPVSSNERLGLKAQTLLRHLDAFSGRIGYPLERPQLIQSFERGEFAFAEEKRRYSVLDHYQRLFLHENALRVALQAGILEYVGFFSGDKPERLENYGFDEAHLTADDLQDLRAFVTAQTTKAGVRSTQGSADA